ncbi:hypothetical protein HPB47_001449 [Ixodes persulcatus]|uniref:Uncharacterized protein n=1 Tax=Ixodes persulcatus TaxID=34615 RepID=A0AC60PQI5_IXOPE|nr:hypothetical protein HPB47_001449 [Ixodes persulcatus]
MGFDGLMIGRISRDVQRRWEASRHMEFVWLTDPFNQEPEVDLFTWVPPYSYTTPGIFCLDVLSCMNSMSYASRTRITVQEDAIEHYIDQGDTDETGISGEPRELRDSGNSGAFKQRTLRYLPNSNRRSSWSDRCYSRTPAPRLGKAASSETATKPKVKGTTRD